MDRSGGIDCGDLFIISLQQRRTLADTFMQLGETQRRPN